MEKEKPDEKMRVYEVGREGFEHGEEIWIRTTREIEVVTEEEGLYCREIDVEGWEPGIDLIIK